MPASTREAEGGLGDTGSGAQRTLSRDLRAKERADDTEERRGLWQTTSYPSAPSRPSTERQGASRVCP